MHDTNISIPVTLKQRLESWKPRFNVSEVCTQALRNYVAMLEMLPPEELPTRTVRRRAGKMSYHRIKYPEDLANQIQQYQQHINVSAVCTEALQEFVDKLEELPTHIKDTLKNQ